MSKTDMSAKAITQRLRTVGRLANLDPNTRFESKIDLTPEGIARRLRRVSELRRLCLSLGRSE